METCKARGRSRPESSPPAPCPSGWSHRLQRVRPPSGGSKTPHPAPASSPPPAAARTCARAWIRFDSFFSLQVSPSYLNICGPWSAEELVPLEGWCRQSILDASELEGYRTEYVVKTTTKRKSNKLPKLEALLIQNPAE